MHVFKTLLLSNVYILLYKRTLKIARLTRVYEHLFVYSLDYMLYTVSDTSNSSGMYELANLCLYCL